MAEAGRDVTFLVRPARAVALRESGLRLVGRAGGPQDQVRAVDVNVLTADRLREAEPFDIVLLAVKACGLDSAIADVEPALARGAAVLPLLNGMRHLDLLAERFGRRQLLGGFAFVSANLDGQGRIVTGPVPASITYGELDGSISDRIGRFHRDADGCGFRATLSGTILADMWAKGSTWRHSPI